MMNANHLHTLGLATVSGAIPFHEIVMRLIDEGVESYHVDYATLRMRFYGAEGGSVEVPLMLDAADPIAGDFDTAALRAAIVDSQQHGQKFKDFSRRAVAAGVAGYFAFLRGRRVTYFGRQGDQHIEWFPSGDAPAHAVRFGRLAAALCVADLERSMAFYSSVLGFRKVFENGTPTVFAILEKDAAELHLTTEGTPTAGTHNAAHLMVDDAAALHAHLQRHGVPIVKALRDADFGLRCFVFADPDGHRIDVGQDL